MAQTAPDFARHDPVWTDLREEAERIVSDDPALATLVHASVLAHPRFDRALSFVLAQKLGAAEMPAIMARQIVAGALDGDPEIGAAARADLVAVLERDPACRRKIEPFLFFKGFHALQAHRIAHWLWRSGREDSALYMQSRTSVMFGVDIHPAARIGRGVMMDHATGVVIGETALVEDDVSMLHQVTLGGTGKEGGDRHPKVRQGALIGAGAKILGNIEVGECARVAAGSVVLRDVPAHCTVAGVPAKVIGCAGSEHPAHDMNQRWIEDSDGET